MSKKRGVSAEEKKTRMLQIFYEKKEFFQLKELEKIGPKEKGVIAQSVKDVIQSLVDDGLVDSEKIGTSIYFWAYPSKARISKEKNIKEIDVAIVEKKEKMKIAKYLLEKSKTDKGDSEGRAELMKRLEELRNKKATLEKEIQKFSDCDPEVLEKLQKESKEHTDAANRWTDNIFAVKSWCKSKFMIEESAIDKQFGIPMDLDYIE